MLVRGELMGRVQGLWRLLGCMQTSPQRCGLSSGWHEDLKPQNLRCLAALHITVKWPTTL